jgi:hypothetical protein
MLRGTLLVAALTQAAGQTWTGTLAHEGWSSATCAGTPADTATVERVDALSDGCSCMSGTEGDGTPWTHKQCHSCNGAYTTSVALTTGCNAGCSSCDGVSVTSTYPGSGLNFREALTTAGTCISFTSVVSGLTPDLRSAQYSTLSSDEATEIITALNGCLASPPPSPPPETDPCFPSSSSVSLADGMTKRLDALKEGDEIVAATAEGALTTDTVSLLSIAMPEAQDKALLTLTTAANATLTLTPEHHLPFGAECCSSLKQAKDVEVDDKVWTVVAGKAVATTVTAIAKAHAKGLHSPVLTNGGFPIVDGVVTSFDSIDKVTLAKHGLAPLLKACKATGTCETFRDMFLSTEDRHYIA